MSSAQNKCSLCGKAGSDMKLCGGCRTTKYCSRECQIASWSAHKQLCKELRRVDESTRKTLYKNRYIEGEQPLSAADSLLKVRDAESKAKVGEDWRSLLRRLASVGLRASLAAGSIEGEKTKLLAQQCLDSMDATPTSALLELLSKCAEAASGSTLWRLEAAVCLALAVENHLQRFIVEINYLNELTKFYPPGDPVLQSLSAAELMQDGLQRAAYLAQRHAEYTQRRNVAGYLRGCATALLGQALHIPADDASFTQKQRQFARAYAVSNAYGYFPPKVPREHSDAIDRSITLAKDIDEEFPFFKPPLPPLSYRQLLSKIDKVKFMAGTKASPKKLAALVGEIIRAAGPLVGHEVPDVCQAATTCLVNCYFALADRKYSKLGDNVLAPVLALSGNESRRPQYLLGLMAKARFRNLLHKQPDETIAMLEPYVESPYATDELKHTFAEAVNAQQEHAVREGRVDKDGTASLQRLASQSAAQLGPTHPQSLRTKHNLLKQQRTALQNTPEGPLRTADWKRELETVLTAFQELLAEMKAAHMTMENDYLSVIFELMGGLSTPGIDRQEDAIALIREEVRRFSDPSQERGQWQWVDGTIYTLIELPQRAFDSLNWPAVYRDHLLQLIAEQLKRISRMGPSRHEFKQNLLIQGYLLLHQKGVMKKRPKNDRILETKILEFL